ncbi:hypothetical protein HanRHA438_Chr14g0675721 [Helianthus annuus]|nr:hypothetical protein HanRHA438_Chr14g0675721 [Helianthus annuus]
MYAQRQWRTQELFSGGANEGFNQIFKGCNRDFYLENTLKILFSRGAPAHPSQSLGPPLLKGIV